MSYFKNISKMRSPFSKKKTVQRGLALVEFAFVASLVFFPLLIGIMEFGRWLFVLNSANEATRLGARLAVVCTKDTATEALIKRKMREIMGNSAEVAAGNIVISYSPPNCTAMGTINCESVTVSLNGAKFKPLIPDFSSSIFVIPSFSTTLPREYMNTTCS